MKKVLLIVSLLMAMAIPSLAQGVVMANAFTNLDEDYAYQTNIALYWTGTAFDVSGSSSTPAWSALNNRVITDFSGNTNLLENKITYISANQINIILYSTSNTSTGFWGADAFSTYPDNPRSATLKVQKWNGSSWVTYKSVNFTARTVQPVPKVNSSNSIIYGDLYDPSGNYIKFHDGTTSSPIYTGAAIDANRNFFVPLVTGAAAASKGLAGSCYPYARPSISFPPYVGYTHLPAGDIYGGIYFDSAYEGIQQVNFRVPASITNQMKVKFTAATNCGAVDFSIGPSSTGWLMGNWY